MQTSGRRLTRERVLVNLLIIHFCRFLTSITKVSFSLNFIRHCVGWTVTAKLLISGSSPLSASVLHRCTATVQTVVENSRLCPSGVKKPPREQKKKKNPFNTLLMAIRSVGVHDCLMEEEEEGAPSTHTAVAISPYELGVHHAACYTYKSLHSENTRNNTK